MTIRKQLVLPLLVIAAGFGVFANAQTTKKPAAKPAAKKVRVFFMEPKNNATVSSPLHMKFGSEGIEIAAVPPGDVTFLRNVAGSSGERCSNSPEPATVSRASFSASSFGRPAAIPACASASAKRKT